MKKTVAEARAAVPVPQMTEENQRMLLKVQEELVDALALLPPGHQELLLAISAGATVKEAAAQADMKAISAYSVLRSTRAHEVRVLLARRWAIEYGVPRAWKREQLIWIAEKHRADMPAAAIAALRLLAELDGDLESPLVVFEDNRQVVVTAETLATLAKRVLEDKSHGSSDD